MTAIIAKLARGFLALYSLAYRLQEAELELVAKLPQNLRAWRPDWEFNQIMGVDVGANVGAYTYTMSQVCHQVLALEPNEQATWALERAHLANCHLVHAAASDGPGTTYLCHDNARGWRRPTAMVSDEDLSEAVWAVPIKKIALDSLFKQCPDRLQRSVVILKLDVEGHESLALSGMTSLLRLPQVVLIVELEDRGTQNHADVFRNLIEHGFEAYQFARGALFPANESNIEIVSEGGAGPFARVRGHNSNFVFLKNR